MDPKGALGLLAVAALYQMMFSLTLQPSNIVWVIAILSFVSCIFSILMSIVYLACNGWKYYGREKICNSHNGVWIEISVSFANCLLLSLSPFCCAALFSYIFCRSWCQRYLCFHNILQTVLPIHWSMTYISVVPSIFSLAHSSGWRGQMQFVLFHWLRVVNKSYNIEL